jgi:predicted RNase H-like HicB family nuclease
MKIEGIFNDNCRDTPPVNFCQGPFRCMKYEKMKNDMLGFVVVISPSEEGFAVSVPELPGCWSQGETEAEAMENIRDVVREYFGGVRIARRQGMNDTVGKSGRPKPVSRTS